MKNLKDIIKKIKEIHKISNKSYASIIKDILYCKRKYKSSIRDYYSFQFYKRTKFERNTYITEGINKEYIRKYNNYKYKMNLKNRIEFNKLFSKALNREWLELRKTDFNTFKKFCYKHRTIIVRQSNKQKIIDTSNQDLRKIYDKLMEYSSVVIENQLKICKTLERLQPNSMNVIKIVTFLGKTSMAVLEIGNKNKQINFFKDSLIAEININTGKIDYPAIDFKLNTYIKHPLTHKQIKGIKIPKWEAAKTLCETASLEIPLLGYIEWSICILEDKCSLIGVNAIPSYYLYQLSTHSDKKVGRLPILKEIERKIEE